jgi:predicted O-methyltransferase YrrM
MNRKIKSLLSSLEKTRHLFWNISKETGLFLNQIIRVTNTKTVLEIGTSNGYSGIWIAEALMQNSKKSATKITKSKPKPISKTFRLYTIESHKKLRFNLATENFKKAKLTPFITQILGHAPDVIPPKPAKFDLIFLDATKYEHPDYLKAILPRTHKGSIIITDNAISHKKELAPYIKNLKKLKNFETNLLDIGAGLLITQNRSREKKKDQELISTPHHVLSSDPTQRQK